MKIKIEWVYFGTKQEATRGPLYLLEIENFT